MNLQGLETRNLLNSNVWRDVISIGTMRISRRFTSLGCLPHFIDTRATRLAGERVLRFLHTFNRLIRDYSCWMEDNSSVAS